VGGSVEQRWLWRSGLQPAAQLDPDGSVEQRYVYADGVNVPDLVIDVPSGARWRLVKDHLGSVRMVVDVGTGGLMRRVDFDAWGRVLSASGDLEAVPFGLAGGLWDTETGLVRFGARDYEAETGRWTSKDPIRFEGDSTNLYAYVGGDPVNYVDYTGRQATAALQAGATAAAVVTVYAGLQACANDPVCHDAAAEAIDDGVSYAVDTLTDALMSIGKGVCGPYRDPPRPPPPDKCAIAALSCAVACGAGSQPQPTYGQYEVCFKACMTASGC
jgi:RHS repeat-associated protein